MEENHKHMVSVTACVPAEPERLYGILANYRDGHARILPPQFTDLKVEEGGVGAGTIIRIQMRVLGKKRDAKAAITEPEPGRVLVETDLGRSGVVTTFRVDPGPPSGPSRVTITTEVPVRGGLLGAIERKIATWYLRPIYEQELKLLAATAHQ
jgi:hypothetical protein